MTKKIKAYMEVTPSGRRVRTDYIPNQLVKVSRLHHPMQDSYGTWSGAKASIHRKLKEAITKGDEKRQLQMYKCLVIMIENNQYSNFMNGFDSEFKMPVIPEFKDAMVEFQKRMM